MSGELPKIVVIIPAYRVENYIGQVVQNIPQFVQQIIVVNDASPDNTINVLETMSDPRLIVINHESNRGVGGAMISGYNRAVAEGADILVKMDGDDQMDPSCLLHLINPILAHQADFTKGNRFLNQKQLGKMPVIRRIGNLGLTFLVKAASGYWKIFDPSNGFTAMSARVWTQLDQDRIARDYFFETSLLIELRYHNAVIKDIPIPARYQDEESSLSIPQILFSFPSRLIKATLRRIIYQYYLYDFSFVSIAIVLGIILELFGFTWGIWYWALSTQTRIPTTTGTVLIAVLPIILGTQLLLQAIAEDIRNIPDEVIHKQQNQDFDGSEH